MTLPPIRTRVQVVDELVAGRRAHRWRYLGQVASGEYAVEVDLDGTAVQRRHSVAGMSAYLDGHKIGAERLYRVNPGPTGTAPLPDSVRHLLNCPSVLDQRRIRVAHAMERKGWTFADVAAELRAQRSTVRDLLRYGRTPARVTASSRSLAEIEGLLAVELARGYGRRPGAVPNVPRVAALADVRRLEPVELVRARALALAVEHGLLATWSPGDVTDLRAARLVEVITAAASTHAVRTADVIAWARGLADGVATSTRWPAAAIEQARLLAKALS